MLCKSDLISKISLAGATEGEISNTGLIGVGERIGRETEGEETLLLKYIANKINNKTKKANKIIINRFFISDTVHHVNKNGNDPGKAINRLNQQFVYLRAYPLAVSLRK